MQSTCIGGEFLPRNKYPEETVQKILDASLKLFLEKGFDKTSMNDIATTAGISKGAIYHHFQSKDAIIKAVTEKKAQVIKETMNNWLSEMNSLCDEYPYEKCRICFSLYARLRL